MALDWVFMLPMGPVGMGGQGRVMRTKTTGKAWVPSGLEEWREKASEGRCWQSPDVGTGPAHLHATPSFPMGKAGSCLSQGPWLGEGNRVRV